MFVARREVAIGPHGFMPGDPITREAQGCLPAGRLHQLVNIGVVEEVVDETVLARTVDMLEAQIVALGARVDQLEAAMGHTGPADPPKRRGRPPKIRPVLGPEPVPEPAFDEGAPHGS